MVQALVDSDAGALSIFCGGGVCAAVEVVCLGQFFEDLCGMHDRGRVENIGGALRALHFIFTTN